MLPGHFFLLRKLPGFGLYKPEIRKKHEVEQFLSVFIRNKKKSLSRNKWQTVIFMTKLRI